MGFWKNTKQIQQVVSRLDFKFSDQGPNLGIEKIRADAARRARFNAGNGLQLHRIARRMRIWPGPFGNPNNPDAKKWWGFLSWLHTQQNRAPGRVNTAGEDIKEFIKTALDAMDCKAIKFCAVEGPVGSGVTVVSNAIPVAGPSFVTLIVMQTEEHATDTPNAPAEGEEDPPAEDLP